MTKFILGVSYAMKYMLASAMLFVFLTGFAACSAGGVSQEEYDAVVAERDALREQLDGFAGNSSAPTQSPSNTETQTAAFDADAAVSQLDIKEYVYVTSFDSYMDFLIIENNSAYNIDIEVELKSYDADGNIIGAKSSGEDALYSGNKTILWFVLDEKPVSTKYDVSAAETSKENAISYLSYETSHALNKEIVSVTNNGDRPVDFVEAVAVFFSGEIVVDFASTYFTDNDSELKPGKTITAELASMENYDSFVLVLKGDL